MNYMERIEKRESIREFKDQALTEEEIAAIKKAFEQAGRLVPSIDIEMKICTGVGARLEGVAGYQGYAFNAPAYLVFLSEKADGYQENAGYVVEDVILALTELSIETCWLTFYDTDSVKRALLMDKESKDVVSILACGQGKPEREKRRLDIVSPSSVNLITREGHVAPKIAKEDVAFSGTWGNPFNWDDEFIDPVLDHALYAATLAPSFLNKQPYRFIVAGSKVIMVNDDQEGTTELDNAINIGAAMLNFAAAANEVHPNAGTWKLGKPEGNTDFGQPAEYEIVGYFC